MPLSEADTCRKFVVPKLQEAGWDNEPHSIAEQRTITDGRIVPVGKGFVRKPPKRVDYLLRYERNFPLAVVEAKAVYKSAGDGLQQAKAYAEMLGLKFAYATNGRNIIEFDYFTGQETLVSSFAKPAELWARYRTGAKLSDSVALRVLTPMEHTVGKGERYYQEIAVNRAFEGVLMGRRRQLITMATGTGKTAVAFQICWKLWSARRAEILGRDSAGRQTAYLGVVAGEIMSTLSRIEWTEMTWNPTVGCTKISPGCKHCYAETMARRLQAMGARAYENGFRLTLMPDRLSEPLERRKPTVYFVNSMSDLFHEKVPFDYVRRVFDVMARAQQHTFQVLTKRAERMAEFCRGVEVPANVWLGVSVENRKYGLPRIDELRAIAARIRFLSVEPLLEDLGAVDLSGIQWVIVGGESGPKARPMRKEWVDGVKRQCDMAGVAFFFKQWGAWGADGQKRSKAKNGRRFRGKTWEAMPQGPSVAA